MNGILIIDKPPEWTSHDVVAKLRGLLGLRRIGHGGTLDPMATGVLPVFVGRATRAVSLLPGGKTYRAVLRLGVTTDTQDITGNVIARSNNLPSKQQVVEAVRSFSGDCMQVPPMVSAVKINGQRLYKLARKGIEVERPARPVTFFRIDVSPLPDGEYSLEVACSGGAYIRTLCHDIGEKLGCGGTLASLRRIQSGPFTLNDAVTLETVAQTSDRASLLRPADSLFADRKPLTVTEKQEARILNGADFAVSGIEDGEYRVYSRGGEFLMLGRAGGGRVTAVKSFFDAERGKTGSFNG